MNCESLVSAKVRVRPALKSIKDAQALGVQLISRAQVCYDEWDESDIDTYGGGGICHLIAEAMVDVLLEAGIDAQTTDSNFEHCSVLQSIPRLASSAFHPARDFICRRQRSLRSRSLIAATLLAADLQRVEPPFRQRVQRGSQPVTLDLDGAEEALLVDAHFNGPILGVHHRVVVGF